MSQYPSQHLPPVQRPATQKPAICDYEGSTYRVDFWEGKGRDYEDAVERAALRRLLPAQGRRYVDLGGGFGRLVDEAARYDQIVLVDYSRTMLQEALQHTRARLGDQASNPKLIYVAADLYRLPFAANTFDVGILCRVIHHLEDAPAALAQIRACFAPGGTFILEFANKLNLKAIARYALRRQSWSPYTPDPVEFVRLNFDFHPRYIRDALRRTGFAPRRRLAVSWLRLGLFKAMLPLRLMVGLDRLLQPLGQWLPFAPSIFVESKVPGDISAPASGLAPDDAMFKCPITGAALYREGDVMRPAGEGPRWAIRDGIYDFKEPV